MTARPTGDPGELDWTGAKTVKAAWERSPLLRSLWAIRQENGDLRAREYGEAGREQVEQTVEPGEVVVHRTETTTCGPWSDEPPAGVPEPASTDRELLLDDLHRAWANCPHAVGFCHTCVWAALAASPGVAGEGHDGAAPERRCTGCGQPLRLDSRGLNTCDTPECPGNIAPAGEGHDEGLRHGDHAYAPGRDMDHPDTRDPRWCNTCGEALTSVLPLAAAPVAAPTEPDDDHAHVVCEIDQCPDVDDEVGTHCGVCGEPMAAAPTEEREARALVHAATVDDGLWSPRCDPPLRWSVPLVAVNGPDAAADAVTCPACRAALSPVPSDPQEKP